MPQRRGGDERGSVWNGVLLTLTVLVAIFVVLALVAGGRRGTVRRGWVETLGTPEQVLARYPSRGANDVAVELERLGAGVGIDLVPRWDTGRERLVDRHRDRPAAAAVRALGSWMAERVARERLDEVPPPRAAGAILEARRDAIDAVRERLLAGEPPRWTVDPAQLSSSPVPNLMGLLELQKLLVADAVRSIQLGDEASAERSLLASWRLVEPLLDDPLLVGRLVAFSGMRCTVGALRLLDAIPPAWDDRLARHDFRELIVEAMLYESWLWSRIDAVDPDPRERVGPLAATIRQFAAPYVDLCLADASERLRRRLVRLRDAELPCDADPRRVGIDLTVELPPWNVAGRMALARFGGAVSRAQRLRIDVELTRTVIALQAAHRAGGGRWPAELPGGERPAACPHDRWVYERDGNGARLALDREPVWVEPPQGLVLPVRWSSR